MKQKKLLAKVLSCTLAVSLLPSSLTWVSAAAERETTLPEPAYFWDFESQPVNDKITGSGFAANQEAALHGADIQPAAISIDGTDYSESDNCTLRLTGGSKGSSYVELPADLYSGVTAENGLTWSFWMKPDENVASYSRLFSSVNNGMEFAFTPYADDHVWNLILEEGSDAYRQIYTTEPAKGSWNYITITVSDHEVIFYTNGNKSASTCGKGDAALLKRMLGKLSGCTRHALGKTSASWTDPDCAVQLDDVAVYNTALTHRQVISLAKSYGLKPDEPARPETPQDAAEGIYGTGNNKRTLTAVDALTTAQGANTVKIWSDDNDRYYYSVSRAGNVVIECSALGLTTTDADLTTGLTLGEHSVTTGTEDYPILQGSSSHVKKDYTELSFDLTKGNSKVTVVFRIFEDGIAYRYIVDANTKTSAETTEITGEASEFILPDKGTIWTTDQSETYEARDYTKRTMIDQYDSAAVYSTPILASLAEDSGNAWVLLSEANVYNENEPYCGSIFKTDAERKAFQMTFGKYLIEETDESFDKQKYTPHYDYISSVTMKDIFHTPWRAAVITDDLEGIANSSLITDLNPAPALGSDFSWIEPGTSVWSWWSTSYDAIQYTTMKDYIDFAAETGIKYCLVDYGWELWEDYRTQVADLVKYADKKGVGLLLWYGVNKFDQQHIFDLDSPEAIEEEFAWCEEIGIKGVKVDYINSVSQFAMGVMHDLARIAAEHHLVLNYHGCVNPSGESRTYPNILSNEAVRGMENFKWNSGPGIESLLTIPFTRNVLGSMEFTPTAYKDQNSKATAGFMLANVVVYESAVQTFAQSAYNYPGYAGLSLLADVPAVWDESRLIDGYPGTHVIRARRNGENWYLGAMTLEKNTYSIPLSFLDAGKTYHAYIYKDNSDGTNIKLETKEVTSADTLPLTLLANGGCSVKFSENDPLKTTIYDNFSYYEAEDSSYAVLNGEAKAAANQFASNLKCVGYVGGNAANTLTFRNIPAEKAGNYTLNVYFIAGAARSLYIRVNNEDPILLEGLVGNANDWKAVASKPVTVKLQAGTNEICLYNNSDYAPDIDRISVSKTDTGTLAAQDLIAKTGAEAAGTDESGNITASLAVTTSQIHLPSEAGTPKSEISWTMEPDDIIAADGAVSLPDHVADGTKEVTMTASITGTDTKVIFHCSVYKQASVTFDLNGGSGPGDYNEQKLKKDDVVVKPSDPVREGYEFAGWYTENAKEPYDFSSKITADKICLTARWNNKQPVPPDDNEDPAKTLEAAKTALTAGIQTIRKHTSTLKESDYTAESWNALQDALAKAEAALKNPNASAADITAAKTALDTAYSKLAKTSDAENPPAGKDPIQISKITFAAKNYKIAAGKKIKLAPKISPSNAENTTLIFSSSNKKYATVSSKGIVTVKKAGAGKTVKITAKAKDGSKTSAAVTIKIMKQAVKKITITAKSKKIKAGKKLKLKANVKTTGNGKYANKTLAWTSSKTKYATVTKKGVVTAKKAGIGKTVTITAKSTDGTNKKASIKLTIKK